MRVTTHKAVYRNNMTTTTKDCDLNKTMYRCINITNLRIPIALTSYLRYINYCAN